MQGRRERGIERCVNHDLSVFIAKVMENYLAMGLEPRIFRLVEAFTDWLQTSGPSVYSV